MNTFINNLRNTLARALSVKATDTAATQAADKAADKYENDRRIRILQNTAPAEIREPLVGHVSTADLLDFGSKYTRSAVAQLGCWSAMARGFSEFVKNPKSEKVDGLCYEFHAWNAVAGDSSEMDDNGTLETIARLSQVKPAKGNKDTDAIIARVLHKSIDEVKADREAKAAVATKKREEAIINFNSLLWSNMHSDGEYSMPAEKVVSKLEQTLLWMAGWDTTNPDTLAAELLLVEADIKMVKSIAAKSVGATHDYEDGMMCADTLGRQLRA